MKQNPNLLSGLSGLAAVLLIAVFSARAQSQAVDSYEKLRKAKLARPVFERTAWCFDYDVARATARRKGKLILAYFTRSFAP